MANRVTPTATGSEPSDVELLATKTALLADYGRYLATAMGGRHLEWGGGVLCDANSGSRQRNMVVCHRELAEVECARLREHALEFFAASDVWVVYSVHPQPRLNHHLRWLEATPIMWRSRPASVPDPPPGVTLREVGTDAELAIAEQIREAAYGRAYRGPTGGYFDARVLSPAYRWWNAYLDGTAVGTASVFVGDGANLLRNVAVRPEFRGSGIGGLLSEHAVGHGEGIAMLDATAAAEPLYTRLGFRTVGNLEFWTLDEPAIA